MPVRALLIAALLSLVLLAGLPATAQQPPPSALEISTPYPALAVRAGDSTSLDLLVRAPDRRRVDLALDGIPDGWGASLRGGGFAVDGVTADPVEPPTVTLDIDVPDDAAEGAHTIVVSGTGGGQTSTLEVTIRVSEHAAGSASLTTDFPLLQGPSDATFAFDLTLANDTPAEATFALSATGPAGWDVTVTPTGEERATTTTVEGGSTTTVRAEVDPPDDAPSGPHEVTVRAVAGATTAEVVLGVELTGNPEIALSTATERLDTEVTAGGETEVVLLVTNDGTSPLVGTTFASTPPAGWDVSFEPEQLDRLDPGGVAEVVATINPAQDSVAGDYLVTLRASNPEAGDDSVEIRTSVGRSSTAGVVGVGLVVVALLALTGVFRGLGRR